MTNATPNAPGDDLSAARLRRAASGALPRDWRAVYVEPGTTYIDEPSELMDPGWFVCAAWSDDPAEGAGLILKVELALDETGLTLETLARALAVSLGGGAA